MAREASLEGLVCAAGNAAEAASIDGLRVVPVETLRDCIGYLRGTWTPKEIVSRPETPHEIVEDFADVRGQDDPKRALEVAAAGGHNVLLIGPPGSGKTMLARRLPTILPPMSHEQSLEVTRIYSVAGLLGEGAGLLTERPFRSPHHHVSLAGLIGGGPALARPGEVSLAHHGVLFLDELPLYKRESLESLRGPLEDGVVRIARSGGAVTYPCRFSLVAAMNPCPCGFEGDKTRRCRCSPKEVQAYSARISGPLLDRFDILVKMNRLTRAELFEASRGDRSAAIRERVEKARAVQRDRYASATLTNAAASHRLLERFAGVTDGASRLLGEAVDGLLLSGRGVDRTVRLARTIADLAGCRSVLESHVAQALQLRFDRLDQEAAA